MRKTYPPAVKDSNYNRSAGAWNGRGKWKLCLHTTETTGEPDYAGNALAPHLTYNPKDRSWKQHYDLDRPSESLRYYDNWQTYQVEIICYSAKAIADAHSARRWVGDLTDTHLRDVADFYLWLVGEGVPIPAVWPQRQAFSYSQANAPGFRYTEAEFEAFGGILAHQHVPRNTHWDTGAFPWERFMSKLERTDDMQAILAALQAQDMEFYRALQAKTGSPVGNADYWGKDYQGTPKPTAAEWQSAAPELFAAALEAGVLSGGITQAELDAHAADPDAHHE